jgi:hypothetical protein
MINGAREEDTTRTIEVAGASDGAVSDGLLLVLVLERSRCSAKRPHEPPAAVYTAKAPSNGGARPA